MVSVLTWVLAGIVVYALLAMALDARGLLPEFVTVTGPFLTVSTQRGKVLLQRLSAPRRFWRAYTNVGIGIGLVVMAGSFFLFFLAGLGSILQPPEPTAVTNPRNALVIPGFNEFLPLSIAPYLLVGILIGILVHEGGHGLLCRVEDIEIESMGVFLFTLLPLGAFVEPNEENRAAADRGAQTRMFVAGVTNNFVLAAVAIGLLLGPVSGAIAVVDGVPVQAPLPGGPADEAGIDSGDVILSADGTAVSDGDELTAVLANTTGEELAVELEGGEAITVTRRLIVRSAPPNSPLGVNTTVTAVNGTAVYTRAGFYDAIRDRQIATLGTRSGTVTLPMGAIADVSPDGPLAAAGLTRDRTVLTEVAGERILFRDDVGEALAGRTPGETVAVTAAVDDRLRTFDVTLGSADGGDRAIIGVRLPQSGTTGLLFSDFGIDEYPADRFLAILGGDGGPDYAGASLGWQVAQYFAMPFLAALPGGGSAGFVGFIGLASNFYVVQGPLSVLGPGLVFVLANVLFWTGWINLLLGQFNLIPAYPLDGGHLLRTSTEAVVSRLPVERKQLLTKAVTISVGLSMLLAILAAYLAPRLLR